MLDKVIGCSWDKINDVLKDWEQVMKNAEKISAEIGFRLFVDNPQCKEIFPTLKKVEDENLITNEDFLLHSRAVLRGLDLCMKNLSAEYEEDNEILPIISATHKRRGVTCSMMQELKEAETKTGNHLKNLFHVKTTRRSSLAEIREINATLTNSPTSPITLLRKQSINTKTVSPTLSDRRPSRAFLHPDHAKFMVKGPAFLTPPSKRFSLSFEDSRSIQNSLQPSPLSSSAASSITSISNAPALESNCSDPLQNYESRRSSTTTNKYSLLDAHDLEYALIRAAARGSIGPYSLSQSSQKLTFTQSLAFPELARGVSKKRDASQNNNRNKLNPLDSGVNAFAKVATALLLVLISILVFGVLYKFIRT